MKNVFWALALPRTFDWSDARFVETWGERAAASFNGEKPTPPFASVNPYRAIEVKDQFSAERDKSNPPARELVNAHVSKAYWQGLSPAPSEARSREETARLMVQRVLWLQIDDHFPGMDYKDLSLFTSDAPKSISLHTEGVSEIGGIHWAANISDRESEADGIRLTAVLFSDADLAKMETDKQYSLSSSSSQSSRLSWTFDPALKIQKP